MSTGRQPTAVPVFAVGAHGGITETTRLNTFSEFTRAVGDFDPKQTLHVALRSYFDNGGGYCYLVPTARWTTELPKLDDVTLLVAAGQDVRAQVLELCVPGAHRFALLDGPEAELTKDSAESLPSTSHAAAYFPWLTADWAETPIPPSATVAGVFCRVDRERGVWKAPANVALNGGVRPVHRISDEQQAQYTDGKALNMIREFPGQGTVVWGARTLEAESTAWRYVPVRRLFDSVERHIQATLSPVIFEPNSSATWERVRAAIENYLYTLWKQGALVGTSPQESYSVQVGEGVTMTPDDVSKGVLRVRVALAAVRPAEFIVLEFTQQLGG
ncbi:phage tail sheath family protein [Archangium primigenium]|uniref:phage tail sheath family protein n=1 Tax=[Archangium] primigenium TaxID=2792470 RepID=UPI0019591871|nr:phage tail sheath C-terminal domain-containing protein [Archangium primigenium]